MAKKAPPQLELFNSMTKKEPFQPVVEGKISMYVCGITPYDLSHIGNARVYVAFDVLYSEILLKHAQFGRIGYFQVCEKHGAG